MRLSTVFTLWFSLATGCIASFRPNIVIILADDMGWNDVGFHGGDVLTPNIDALAYHGVIFNRHYSQPVCTPSRAALLTGNYPFRYGVQGMPFLAGHKTALPENVTILPQYFSKLGYKTHLVGKWHVGYYSPQYLPNKRGFDSFFGYYNGYLGYWDGTHQAEFHAGRDIWRNGEGAWREVYGRYLTDVLTEEAIRVIDDHAGSEGLFLMVNHNAVHSTFLPNSREAPPGVTNHTHRGLFRGMVERLDWSVGEIVEALDKKGLLNHSIVAFLSDNGAPTSSPLLKNGGSNWPLRGQKKSVHDGGVRTVAALWSPSLKKNSRIYGHLFHISDWLPTLYAAAGGSKEELHDVIDGQNHWEALSSGEGRGPRKTLVVDISDGDDVEALIKGRWKLVKNYNPTNRMTVADKYYGEDGRWMDYDWEKVKNSKVSQVLGPLPKSSSELKEVASVNVTCEEKKNCDYCLYNIVEDPTECRDLSTTHSDVVDKLKKTLDVHRRFLMPSIRTKFDNRSDPKYWSDYWEPWIR